MIEDMEAAMMEDMRDDENRCVIAYIDERFIVELLNWWQNPVGRSVYRFACDSKPLPEGVRVGAVTVAVVRRSLVVRLHHHSFDEVEPGYQMPEWNSPLKMASVGVAVEAKLDEAQVDLVNELNEGGQ